MNAFGIEPERLGINLSLDPDGKKIPQLSPRDEGLSCETGPGKNI